MPNTPWQPRRSVQRSSSGIVVANRGTRLERAHDHAVVANRQPRHVRRAREGVAHRAEIAMLEIDDEIARYVIMHARRAGSGGGLSVRDGRKRIDVGHHHLRRVARLVRGVGDHERDRIADKAHLIDRERRLLRPVHGRAVTVADENARRHGAKPGRQQIGAGKNAAHPGHGRRIGRVERAQDAMRDPAADDDRVQLTGKVDVVRVPTLAPQESWVFLARDWLAHAEPGHLSSLLRDRTLRHRHGPRISDAPFLTPRHIGALRPPKQDGSSTRALNCGGRGWLAGGHPRPMFDRAAEMAGLASRPSRGAGTEETVSPAVAMLGALVGMVRRRRLSFALPVLLVPLLAFLAIQQVTPRYTAQADVIYDPSSYSMRELQSILRSDPTTDAVMASQLEIVRGLRMAERLSERFDLARSPEFNPALRHPSWPRRMLTAATAWLVGGGNPQSERQIVASAVQKAIEAKTLKTSRVIEIAFTAANPFLAADGANALAGIYIGDQLALKADAVRRANDWLDTRVGDLRREVTAGEDRMAVYRAQSGLVAGVQAGLPTERISRLTAELVQARDELAAAEARLASARGHGTAAAGDAGDDRAERGRAARATGRAFGPDAFGTGAARTPPSHDRLLARSGRGPQARGASRDRPHRRRNGGRSRSGSRPRVGTGGRAASRAGGG